MRAITLDTIGILILAFIVIIVGIGLVQSFYGDVRESLPYKIADNINNLVYTIFHKTKYDLCKAYYGELIEYQDFISLLTSMKSGKCNYTIITIEFSLTKGDIDILKGIIGVNGVLYTRENKTFGGGLLVVNGNPGYYPLKYDDVIEVRIAGFPERDVYLKVIQHGCDPYDDVCDEACAFKSNICDQLCYSETADYTTCDIDCVDINGDGLIGRDDLDGICDPDCYNNYTNPFKAYDPDCERDVMKARYGFSGVCDPDSNGVEDGICDLDCAKKNGICDPDCNGEISEGNPNALLDKDCYVCNPVKDCFCSKGCTADDNDPDCPNGFDGKIFISNCCGNGICESGENCENCPSDCPGGNETCETYSFTSAICCPDAEDSDKYGCTNSMALGKGSKCSCNVQCSEGLNCNEGLIKGKFCCPGDKKWNGSECIKKKIMSILFIQMNKKINDFEKKAKEGKDYWAQITPLKNCPDSVKAIVVSDKICNAPDQNEICKKIVDKTNRSSDISIEIYTSAIKCATQWGYEGIYTRLVGVYPGDYICEICFDNKCGIIKGFTSIYNPVLITSESNILRTTSHEMGHTFGLCDEGYGNALCSDCQGGICSYSGIDCYPPVTLKECIADLNGYPCPNKPEPNSIMCSLDLCNRGCSNGNVFAPSSYAHLERELNKYCQ